MSLLNSSGFPIGQVGLSQRPEAKSKGIDPVAMEKLYELVQQNMRSDEGIGVLDKRVSINSRKIEEPLAFWKSVYFQYSVEGRLLNGIEAYDLGDINKTPGTSLDKGPYIAMCNIMALEAIRMMGDQMPTAEKSTLLAFASDREKEISAFWKNMFAPTEFQAEWAWRCVLAVLAGNPAAAHELFENYRQQLP